VRGVGQVARGNSALDSGLGLTGASDGFFKAIVAWVKPVNKLKSAGGGLDLNEVFSMKPHDGKKNITISGDVNPLKHKKKFFFIFYFFGDWHTPCS